MLAKRIIPCLDIKNGRVVKGVGFKNHVDMGDPVELAEYYSKEGADELVFYDISASPENRQIDFNWVEKVAKKISIPFTVAGGITNFQTARTLLNLGADKISINTPAINNPDLINELSGKLGVQCVVVGIDTRDNKIFTNTGNPNRTKKSSIDLFNWIEEVQRRGAGEIVLNSMNNDGVKRGYDLNVLKKIKMIAKVPIVASGGAGTCQDFLDVFNKDLADACLAASVFHSKKIKIASLKKYLSDHEIMIRWSE